MTGSIAIIRSITIPIARATAGYRDIVLPLAPHTNASATNSFALSVAREFGASLKGIAFAFDAIVPLTGPLDTIPAHLIEEMAARSQAEAREGALSLERQSQQFDVPVTTMLVHAGFRESEDYFAETARSFDLAIVPQRKPEDELLPNFVETALFHSGRPILAVPYIQRRELSLSHVLVGWDGSRASARAISDAWPLIERARKTSVVTIGHGERPFRLQQELGKHFASHGIHATMSVLAGEDIDAGNAILSHAVDIGADLLIIGGYGHARLREWVLGGVTQTILQTMTIPTLLSH